MLAACLWLLEKFFRHHFTAVGCPGSRRNPTALLSSVSDSGLRGTACRMDLGFRIKDASLVNWQIRLWGLKLSLMPTLLLQLETISSRIPQGGSFRNPPGKSARAFGCTQGTCLQHSLGSQVLFGTERDRKQIFRGAHPSKYFAFYACCSNLAGSRPAWPATHAHTAALPVFPICGLQALGRYVGRQHHTLPRCASKPGHLGKAASKGGCTVAHNNLPP